MLVGHQPDGITISCFIAMWLAASMIANFGVLIASLVTAPWPLVYWAGLLLSMILSPVATTLDGSAWFSQLLRELALGERLPPRSPASWWSWPT